MQSHLSNLSLSSKGNLARYSKCMATLLQSAGDIVHIARDHFLFQSQQTRVPRTRMSTGAG